MRTFELRVTGNMWHSVSVENVNRNFLKQTYDARSFIRSRKPPSSTFERRKALNYDDTVFK